MDKVQENLSASALRHRLIEAIEGFIAGLECSSLPVLQDKKLRIREVLDLLREKEDKEAATIQWGRSSAESAKIIPLTDIKEEPDQEEESESGISELA